MAYGSEGNTSRASTILRQSKLRIDDPKRWHQGSFLPDSVKWSSSSRKVRDTCALCAAGAINLVATGDPRREPRGADPAGPWAYLHRAIYGQLGLVAAEASTKTSVCPDINVISSNIGVWNDDEGRTHDDVLAAFDAAIALAEKEGN